MKTQIAVDLTLARVKSGFTQEDVAHLSGLASRTMRRLEHGQSEPDLNSILLLSLIYGRTFETYFADKLQSMRKHIRRRFEDLPHAEVIRGQHHNRKANLERLKRRLDADIELHA